MVLDSFLIVFGHLVWAILSTALVFTLLGLVRGRPLIKIQLNFSLSTCHGVKISQSHTPRFGTVLPDWYLADLSSKCNWSFFIILMKWHCYNVTLLGLVPCITLITTLHCLRVMTSKFRNVTLLSLVLPVYYVAELFSRLCIIFTSQCHNTILS